MIKNEQILPIFWVSIIGRNNFGRRDGVWVGVWGIMIEANSLCTICLTIYLG